MIYPVILFKKIKNNISTSNFKNYDNKKQPLKTELI